MIDLRARLLGLALFVLFALDASAEAKLVAAGGPGWSLRGEWMQSHIIVGKAAPGSQVWFNGRKLVLSPEGDFVFGLDRDEPAEAELKVQLPSDPLPQTFRYEVAKREYDVQHVDGLPPDKVNPPESALKRIAREQGLIRAAHERDLPLTGFTGVPQWPVVGRVSGNFGNQRILNGVPKQPHYGMDIAVPTGTQVRAPLGGVVSLAEPDLYYTGGTVMVDHGHGFSTIMVHLSKLLVKQGETVQAGQVIAESGMTGRATGPHLHWGGYWFNSRVDVSTLLPPMPEAPALQPRETMPVRK